MSVARTNRGDVRLRPLTGDDVPTLDELERELFGAGAWSAAALAEEIVGPGRWYLGAEVDGTLVGYAGLWFDGDDVQVMTVGTAPHLQGRGIGRLLLDALVERARTLGATSVLLEVRVDNEPALRLYDGAGFERLGRRRGYYQPENVDAWTMRLPLTDPRAAVLVGPAGLAAALAGPEADRPVVLDVRWALGRTDGAEQFALGHVPGSVYVDLDRELAAPPTPQDGRHPLPAPADLEAAARRWGVHADRPVVVLDAVGGTSAARAWWLLRWAGHPRVRLLDGGLAAWRDAGLPLEDGPGGAVEPGDLSVVPGGLPTLDADGLAGFAGRVLDARAGERYRGEVEPVDPRAGHVPGALSAPTVDNLDAQGRFLPTAALRERFASLGVHRPTPVAVYCGSGVTAAHEVAALAATGVDAVLYPGSWSQWSNDPARPVATGA